MDGPRGVAPAESEPVWGGVMKTSLTRSIAVFSLLFLGGCGGGGGGSGPPPPTNPIAQVNFVYPSTLTSNVPFAITILGGNFVSGATVLLGSTPLSAAFVDGAHLTATGTAPAVVGTVNLTVVNPAIISIPSNAYSVTVAAVSQRAAIRFLEQSTFGPNDAQLFALETASRESFLAAQFSAPVTPYPDTPSGVDGIGVPLGAIYFNALQPQANSDQLRQRVEFVLEQIWVISGNKLGRPDVFTPFLNVLVNDAFGNYRTIMEDVTLNPAMGFYLDMVNNAKPDPVAGTHANENYAREFMQLFTIGPNMLNADGTAVLQGGGFVPTYGQADVQALARVFTGWTFPPQPDCSQNFYNSMNGSGPMVACDGNHDVAVKTLFANTPSQITLPANQTAAQDLKGALDAVFNHPNLPPFVARRFIQHLVTSNPSPAFVTRVASAFAIGIFTSNGTTYGRGQRGDMQALIAAILLDPEARRGDEPVTENPLDGHLREPVLYTLSILRAFHGTTILTNGLSGLTKDMGQWPFFAPSVFSFYSPLFNIPLTQPPLSGPEFQIFTSVTSLSRVNDIEGVIMCCLEPGTSIDLSSYVSLAANDPDIMVDAMGSLLLHGTMSSALRTAVLGAVNAVASGDAPTRAKTAAFLITASPQYQVQR